MSTQSEKKDRRFVAILVLALLVLGLLGGCSVAWLLKDGGTDNGSSSFAIKGGSTSAGSKPGHPHFSASGTISGLVPGRPGTLEVVITNEDAVGYRILQLEATAKDASPGCPAANLVIEPYSSTTQGAVTHDVAGKSTTTIPLTVTLRYTSSVQDACKNVKFPLTYSGVAVRTEDKERS